MKVKKLNIDKFRNVNQQIQKIIPVLIKNEQKKINQLRGLHALARRHSADADARSNK